MCRNDVSCYFTDQNELVNNFQIYKDVRYLFLNTLVEPTSTREFCALKSLLCPLAWCWRRCTKRLHICNVSWEKSGYVYCGYHNDEKFPRMFSNEMKWDLHSWQFFASALPVLNSKLRVGPTPEVLDWSLGRRNLIGSEDETKTCAC